jgi:hypothetical protein
LIDESPLRRAGDRDADGRDADLAAQVPAQPSRSTVSDAKAKPVWVCWSYERANST